MACGPPDIAPPSKPGTPTPTAVTATSVDIAWTASTDNVGVTAYRVFRDGVQLAQLPDTPTVFHDSGLAPGSTHRYTTKAVDGAGNASAESGALTVSTPTGGVSALAFAPTDDATIDSANPAVNMGTTNRITVDSSPVNDLLLKFTVTGTGPGTGCPTIRAATLRLTVGSTVNDNSPKGGDFRAAANSNWTEADVTWNTAPAASAGPPVASISTPVALGTAYLVDLSPLVTGNSTFTIRATGNSSDGARYFSRNGNPATVAPELEISCG